MNHINILIVRVSAIGDVVHTLPAIFLLKYLYPQAKISWVVQEKAAVLLKDQPFLNNVWVLPDHYLMPRNWKTTVKIIKEIRTTTWDIIIDFQGLIKTALLLYLFPGKKFGFSAAYAKEKISCWFTHYKTTPAFTNIIQKNLSLASNAAHIMSQPTTNPTLDVLKKDFDLAINKDYQQKVEKWLSHENISTFMLICPNTTWASKHWPVEYWEDTIKLLTKHIKPELKIIIIGHAFGKAAAELTQKNSTHHNIAIAPAWDLLTTAYLIKKAQLLIGPDTGLLHLADFLGTPCIGIFGPTSKEKHGPFINKDNQQFSIQITCPHIYKKHHGKTNKKSCMYQLTPQQLFDQIIRYLEKISSTPLN